MKFNELVKISPYSLSKKEKEKVLTDRIKELTIYHINNCLQYKNILRSIDFNVDRSSSYYD